MRRPSIILLALLALACAAAAKAEPLDLSVTQRSLDPERPELDHVGRLAFLGALEINSAHRDFGGLSGLEVDARGHRLTAITDQGRWLSAELRYDARGWLADLGPAEIGRLHDPAGKPLGKKAVQDAEALAALADGSFLVAFEHRHRIWRYGAASAPLAGRPSVWPPPAGIADLPANNGIEAMTALQDGRLLIIAETEAAPELFPAWLWQGSDWQPLHYQRHAGYRPSGAALLPDGDLLVLERRFSWLGGLGARLVRVPAATLRPGAVLQGQELAVLQPPLITDNWEGVAAARGPNGETLIYLLSDDNFLALQRTLLVLFVLRE